MLHHYDYKKKEQTNDLRFANFNYKAKMLIDYAGMVAAGEL